MRVNVSKTCSWKSEVCQCTLQDCDHATTLVDIGGTLDGSFVSGLKYSNFCGFQATAARHVFFPPRAGSFRGLEAI